MRNQGKYPTLMIIIFVVTLAALALFTWVNYQFVQENPGGNDFLVHWAGTRALVTEGLNPYSEEVAQQIQTHAYGRPARAGEHELRMVYPLYSALLFIPFALIEDFTLARALWMTLLEAALIGLVLISLQLARWRVGPLMAGLLLIFAVFWYHGLRPLIDGNVIILVAFLLAAGVLALRAGADELAGLLFAFCTIKPHVVVLVLFFVFFWSAAQGRWRIIGWMFGTVILLSAAAALIIPTWILDVLREVIRYPSYGPLGTPRAVFIDWWPAWGSRVGWALTGVMVLILLVEWVANRKSDFRGFYWTFCLTLVAAQWIGIQTSPSNFILLLPVIVLVFSLLDDRWRSGGRAFVILNMLVLLGGLWALVLNASESPGLFAQSPGMFFPLPAYLLLTLYWVRWWALEPPTVWYDQLDGR